MQFGTQPSYRYMWHYLKRHSATWDKEYEWKSPSVSGLLQHVRGDRGSVWPGGGQTSSQTPFGEHFAPAVHQQAAGLLPVQKNPEAIWAWSQRFNKQPDCVLVEAQPD